MWLKISCLEWHHLRQRLLGLKTTGLNVWPRDIRRKLSTVPPLHLCLTLATQSYISPAKHTHISNWTICSRVELWVMLVQQERKCAEDKKDGISGSAPCILIYLLIIIKYEWSPYRWIRSCKCTLIRSSVRPSSCPSIHCLPLICAAGVFHTSVSPPWGRPMPDEMYNPSDSNLGPLAHWTCPENHKREASWRQWPNHLSWPLSEQGSSCSTVCSSRMSETLTLSLRLSPALLRRKFILATWIQDTTRSSWPWGS